METKQRYFEDYQIGQKGKTISRTVSEADLLIFASITGDFNSMHMDRHATQENVYGGRIAHGMLGASLMLGMLSLRAPHIVGRGVPDAYLWQCEFNYRNAIRLNDTITCLWEIEEKTEDLAHPGFGKVKSHCDLINQDAVTVYDNTVVTLVKKNSANDKLRLETGTLWDKPSTPINPDRAYWSEDFSIGMGGETDGRTITEADIVNFGCLIGDYNPENMNADYAQTTPFGERVAQGMLICAIANGFRGNFSTRYVMPASDIGGHLADAATFLAPIKIADTIRFRYKITDKRISKSKPGASVITYGIQAINQRNEVVQEISVIFLVPSKIVAQKSNLTK